MNRYGRIIGMVLSLFLLQWFLLPVAHAGLISTKQEIAIGESIVKQIEAKYKLVDDPELQARVERIGKSIVAVCDRPDLPYTFKVLDVDEVNAMAAPGGFIYVFKGLVDLMPTDDELAGIIGHEVGHVVKRHSMAQMEKTLGMSLLFGGVFGDNGVLLQTIALNAIAAGYSRGDERQADLLGYQQSVKAGYNQYAMIMGLTKLYELNPDRKNDLFSDHPEAAARVKLAQKYLADAGVRPTAVATQDKGAKVVDGDWSLPEIHTAVGATGPLYRAYLVAGRLYDLTKNADYSDRKYILDRENGDIVIYYDDQIIITLTPEDAAFYGISVEELADRYITALKSWKCQDKAA